MGVFDTVVFTAPCKNCGELLDSWQTKSGPCMMATILPHECHDFYEYCPKCGTKNHYDVEAVMSLKSLTLKERL